MMREHDLSPRRVDDEELSRDGMDEGWVGGMGDGWIGGGWGTG